MTAAQKCPHCSHPAEELSQKPMGKGVTELAFRCTNSACKANFTGVLTLASGARPGAHNFNGRPTPGTGDPVFTDC